MLICNDNSLTGQFNSLGEFLDTLSDELLPILKHAKQLKQDILKSYTTYSKMVTSTHTLADIIYSGGSAEITAMKSYLVELSHQEPYWDDDIKTDTEAQYNCIYSSEIPDCFTEALERKCGLISFNNKPFDSEKIDIQKDSINYEIPNSYDGNSYLKNLFLFRVINESYYFENLHIGMKIRFCIIGSRRYTQDFFDSLGINDRNKVTKKILLLISHLVNKTDSGTLCKYLDNGLWELRDAISDGIFRIFYIFSTNSYIFLNGFVKKSQETPPKELALARSLAKEYL